MSSSTIKSTDIVLNDESRALVSQLLRDPNVSLADILDQLDLVPEAEVKVKVPEPLVLSEAQRKALATLPEVYGQVAPKGVRKLSEVELEKLVVERKLLSEVETLVKARKDNGIRHIVANHLDTVLDDATRKTAVRDANGHYLVASSQRVGGDKFDWQISQGKPSISAGKIEKAYKDGKLTHSQYLSLTRVPEVHREFDETKAREAVRKDPALLEILANEASTPGKTTGALYLRPYTG